MSHPILDQVRSRIETEAIPYQNAASEIGVTTHSLLRHLNGEYVRSDSLAKYRLWLDQNRMSTRSTLPTRPQNILKLPLLERDPSRARSEPCSLWPRVQIPPRPYRVVDIFAGCGGLSLGFERYEDGRIFELTLAFDLEEPMIRVFNDNHACPGAELPRGRQGDVTDFLNEAEIQGYYLDHLLRTGQDSSLFDELKSLGKYDLGLLRANLRLLDLQFLDRLSAIRSSSDFASTYRKMGSSVLGQTSVIAFHRALKLPITALGPPQFDALLWSNDGEVADLHALTIHPDPQVIRARQRIARRTWDTELRKLTDRSAGSGAGQLSSSATRIRAFLDFITAEHGRAIRAAWVDWRSQREAVRILVFDDLQVQNRLRALYNEGRHVSILLGGPPCQGFSRIGRGKIRSLREQSVHVHEDQESVDSRNQLLEQYVLFVSALSPRMFLFENVRHFQAVVRSGERTFDAAEALAEAIRNVSARGLSYSIASRIVVASDHLVPQVRERYLMVGTRSDVAESVNGVAPPDWCISLPISEPVPLEAALEGLPEPTAPRDESGETASSGQIRIPRFSAPFGCSDSASKMRSWISAGDDGVTDSHVARRPRADDTAFFDLMGPGKRWMDYRCDSAPTLDRLVRVVTAVRHTIKHAPVFRSRLGITDAELQEVEQTLNGSLSLRLLLESIPPLPGETEHHLLAANYLKKKEGQHGDWLARMDPSRPSKTMVSHMGKDTYAYVHPTRPRTLSVREAARIQTFPDSYRFRSVGLVDAFRMIGNAVPPLLSAQFAERLAQVLWLTENPVQTPAGFKAATQTYGRTNTGA
jgi:site-specific DNA-cytosine methylase